MKKAYNKLILFTIVGLSLTGCIKQTELANDTLQDTKELKELTESYTENYNDNIKLLENE